VSGSGKGKSSKPVVRGEGDSDSSFDGYQPSSRSGESVHSQAYDVGEEADVDGMEDDFVVRTDHLRSVE
jgi:peroxin-6